MDTRSLDKKSVESLIKSAAFVLIIVMMLFLAGRVGHLPDISADDTSMNILGNSHCYSTCGFMGE